MKVYKSSVGYFLNLSKEVSIFFDEWEIPEPSPTEIDDWEPHIILIKNKMIVASVLGRKMKEVQVALNRLEREDNN